MKVGWVTGGGVGWLQIRIKGIGKDPFWLCQYPVFKQKSKALQMLMKLVRHSIHNVPLLSVNPDGSRDYLLWRERRPDTAYNGRRSVKNESSLHN